MHPCGTSPAHNYMNGLEHTMMSTCDKWQRGNRSWYSRCSSPSGPVPTLDQNESNPSSVFPGRTQCLRPELINFLSTETDRFAEILKLQVIPPEGHLSVHSWSVPAVCLGSTFSSPRLMPDLGSATLHLFSHSLLRVHRMYGVCRTDL